MKKTSYNGWSFFIMRVEHLLNQIGSETIQAHYAMDASPAVQLGRDAHYQANGALAIAKRIREQPRKIAEVLAHGYEALDWVERAEVGGPGFVNLTLTYEAIQSWLERMLQDRDRLDVDSCLRAEKVVIDFSSPNIAKQMHVGHLRSTILGDALRRVLQFVGHHVVADNHIGDWGTQFGLLIAGVEDAQTEANDLEALEAIYKTASERAKTDDAFAARARAHLVALQAGAPKERALWERFITITKASLDHLYARLGVTFDVWLSESFYHNALPEVVQMLLNQGLARRDEGAVCIFFEDDPDLKSVKTPFIVQKSDGAYLYATTDVATLLYRQDHFRADRSLYVVDSRQSLHFKQLFALAKKMKLDMSLTHISFGSVLGADGKPLKTREGQAITLESLLNEAVTRSKDTLEKQELNVDASQINALAEAIGIGAVKYADLKHNRLSDYRFEWDKLIAFHGNASPYLQYVYARTCSLFRKASLDVHGFEGAAIRLEAPSEHALALILIRFADVVHQVAETYFPHLLCEHLYALAKAYSTFYENCPILSSTSATQQSRLSLAALSARQMKLGLNLLGIAAPDKM